ncbi:DUF3054 domain-containing protein [Salinadaptatus halalkaliphilus]|uniref:DUF3054 domain-containing protein n=1 Tax=Salinadaptatus halalkaliphilus TaxID=2419781 RepID=A0A4S3TV38_9EURY|nr:DUF3054 domain-containing protein [Salinadaptatus halalkaliphilus]THE66548.1 DUF3054 domain-containing protein [Salinadaptatus halalkaliphilus]
MNAATGVDGRSDRFDRTSLSLAVVDITLVICLLLVGQRSHGIDPIADPLATIETVFPFLAGWIVAAVLAGLYTRNMSPSRVLRLTTITWLAAANIGLILRSSPAFDGGASWPFALVITATGLVVLVGWRLCYTAWRNWVQ